MKTIAMVLSNSFRPDPRVEKEAISLINAGYRVVLICWDRTHEYPQNETFRGIEIIRVRVRSTYSAGSRQIFFLFLFLIEAVRQLHRIMPDLVHCHDLDTTLAGAWYGYWHRVPWIFDAHECYPEQIRPQVNRTIYRILIRLERFIARRTTHLITVGETLASRFRSFGAHVTVIGNYPNLESYAKIQGSISRQSVGISNDEIIVSYIGGFTLARMILPLIQAGYNQKNVAIILAGDGPLRNQIEEAIVGHSNIRYIGWISQDQVPAYTVLSDIIYYGLKIEDGNSQYSTPNSLFNSMAAGKPILTTDVGDISRIVKSVQCGVVIPNASVEYIIDGINQLSDPQVRRLMGGNGKNAVDNKYNWVMAQKCLLDIYSNVLKSQDN